MIDNSTKDKLENEPPHFGNTLLAAVAYDTVHYKRKKINKKTFEGWILIKHI